MSIVVPERYKGDVLVVKHELELEKNTSIADYFCKPGYGRIASCFIEMFRLGIFLDPRIFCAYYHQLINGSPKVTSNYGLADPKYCKDTVDTPWRNSVLSRCNVLGAFVLGDPSLTVLLLQDPAGNINMLKVPNIDGEQCFSKDEVSVIASLDDALFSEDYAGHRARDFKAFFANYCGKVISSEQLCDSVEWACREKIVTSSNGQDFDADDMSEHYHYYLARIGEKAEIPEGSQKDNLDHAASSVPDNPKCENRSRTDVRPSGDLRRHGTKAAIGPAPAGDRPSGGKHFRDGVGNIYQGTNSSNSCDSGNAWKPSFENVGRNDPCPCGSGLRFKECHGR